ncbi:MAG TPA: PIN domain-containing protein [Candidatus Sulfotelmatobacter sp.]|nr:PIN domain-containing protein [Candidatus Sulfotelmatobacter sp.]
MNVFADTSVLVSAVIKQHTAHERAFAVLERVQNKKDEGVISAHSLAETYAVLTKLPPLYRHTPEQALLSIEENILKHFKIVGLAGGEYAALLREAAGAGLRGGTIYDALLLKAAIKAGVEVIYTLNLKHFQAFAPPDAVAKLSAP